MTIPHNDATRYISDAIEAFGYIPNPKAIETVRTDILSNYGGNFLSSVLKEAIGRHASLLVKKPAEPVAQPSAQQNAEAVNAQVKEIIRQLSEEFPDINFLTSKYNNRILGDFVDAQGGNINMTVLRTGVRLLLSQLEKNPPPPPPVPEPEPEPPEVLKTLADGSKQLSIRTTTEADLRDPAVTPLQLRDFMFRATGGAKPNARF